MAPRELVSGASGQGRCKTELGLPPPRTSSQPHGIGALGDMKGATCPHPCATVVRSWSRGEAETGEGKAQSISPQQKFPYCVGEGGKAPSCIAHMYCIISRRRHGIIRPGTHMLA